MIYLYSLVSIIKLSLHKYIYLFLFVFLLFFFNQSNLFSQEACGLMPAPNGDDIRCMNAYNDVIYVGTWGNGLFKTADEFSTTQSVVGITGRFITDITYSKTVTNVMYVTSADSGVFRSTNAGNTWVNISNSIPLFVKSITLKPKNGKDIIYIGTFGQGVYRSYDNGATWQQFIDGIFNLDVSTLTTTNSGGVLAGTYGASLAGGIFQLKDSINITDDGKKWKRNSSGMATNRYINSFSHDKYGKVLVAVNGTGSWTSDDGESYYQPGNPDSIGLLKDPNVTCITYANPKPLAIENDETIGTRSKGIWYFDNRINQVWRQATYATEGGVNCITRKSNGTLFCAFACKGIFRSTDNGVSWFSVGSFDYRNNTSLITAGYGGLVYVSPRMGGVYYSKDYGISWSDNIYTRKINNDYPQIFTIKGYNNKIFVGDNDTINTGLRVSADSGKTWNFAATGFKWNIISIAPDPSNLNTIYFLASSYIPGQPAVLQLYKSTNAGISIASVGGTVSGNPFSKIAVAPNGYIWLYQAVAKVGSNFPSMVSYSINGGTSWNQVTPFDATNTTKSVQDIQVDSLNNVYVAASDGFYKLLSGNTSFTTINTIKNVLDARYSPFYVQKMAIKSTTEFYLGFDYGIIKTVNGGTSWTTINNSYNVCITRDMAVGTEGDVYFVASGAYRIVNADLMDAPILKYPPDNAKGIALNPTLTWNQSVRADLYEFQLSEVEDLASVNETVIQGPLLHKVFYTLKENKQYYWRVRGKANGSYSPWSDIFTFNTQVAPPKLIYPANLPDTLSKGIPQICKFSWNQSSDANFYNIQVAKDSLFNNILFSKDSINNDTTYTNLISQKMPALTYLWWRAQSWSNTGSGRSNWSKPNNFFTTLPPPNLVNPKNRSLDEFTTINFKWDSSRTALGYTLQISKDSLFSINAVETIIQADELIKEVKALEYNIKYYWRMSASNSDGISEWSPVWSFTTAIQGPTNALPLNQSVNLDTIVGFSWDKVPKATKYSFQLGSDTNLTGKLIIDTTLSANQNSYIVKLDFYSNYYWRVSAWVDTTHGKWIPTRIFKTGIDKVVIKSPSNGEQNKGISQELRWNDVNFAKSYLVRIAKDKQLKNGIQELQTNVNSKTVLSLDSCTFYYWAVQGVTPEGNGPWSDTLNFKTICSTKDVNDLIAQENSIIIFPNPFSSSVKINFSTTESGLTNINIYNSAGSKVITLFDGNLFFGEHSFDWAPVGIAKGIYYLSIKTKEYEIMREINFK